MYSIDASGTTIAGRKWSQPHQTLTTFLTWVPVMAFKFSDSWICRRLSKRLSNSRLQEEALHPEYSNRREWSRCCHNQPKVPMIVIVCLELVVDMGHCTELRSVNVVNVTWFCLVGIQRQKYLRNFDCCYCKSWLVIILAIFSNGLHYKSRKKNKSTTIIGIFVMWVTLLVVMLF